ncbi:DHA1 family inner membrane transport protein [Actinopolyspora lacussalsi]|nr:DHA1 family inner membrane transport protein [Actinopolyspora lacussalsi]
MRQGDLVYLRIVGLIVAIFGVGTSELMPSGMLEQLAGGLDISLATAGLSVTVYALTMAVGGPLVSAATTAMTRKRILLFLLGIFVLGNGIIAAAPGYAVVLVGRVLTALTHGTFMAVSVVTAGSMVPAHKSGSAVAGVQLGINLATVLGVPFGTLLAQRLSWRSSFAAVCVIAVLAAVLIMITVPDSGTPESSSVRSEVRAFSRWNVVTTVVATVLCSAGMFTIITYLAPLLTRGTGFPAEVVPLLLLGYGAGSVIGNSVGGKLADKSLSAATAVLSGSLTLTCLLCWLGTFSRSAMIPVLLVFALVTFALIPCLQTRVVKTAEEAPTLSLTVNMSAFGLGAAIGSWYGGKIIELGVGVRTVPIGAAVLAIAGMSVIVITVLLERRKTDASRADSRNRTAEKEVI